MSTRPASRSALLPHLRAGSGGVPVQLGDDMELEHYILQRVSAGAIAIAEEPGVYIMRSSGRHRRRPRGGHGPALRDHRACQQPLWQDFTDEERVFLEQIKERQRRARPAECQPGASPQSSRARAPSNLELPRSIFKVVMYP